MDAYVNGGDPAFPVQDAGSWQGHGLTKRELFAVILMHSEAVTCGVPGEACEALVKASAEAGTDVIDHMAMNAAHGADALLRALVPEPRPRPEPAPHLTYNAWATPEVEHRAIQSLSQHPRFSDMPAVIRDFVKVALEEIQKSNDGIPF